MEEAVDSSEVVFCRVLSMDLDSVKKLLDVNDFSRLRIVDIKNILKYYRNNTTMAISLTANKASLVAHLSRIAPLFREGAKGESVLSPCRSGVHSRPVDRMAPKLQSISKPNSLPVPFSHNEHQLLAPGHTVHDPPQQKQFSSTEALQLDTPPTIPVAPVPPFSSSNSPSFLNIIMQSPNNRAVYAELLAASFPAERIHRALVDTYQVLLPSGPVEIDFDTMMCTMICDAEGDMVAISKSELQRREEAEKRRFEADIDRALRESEPERDAIQDRKRRRCHDLNHNPSVSLLDAEEFHASYLLGRWACTEEANLKSMEAESSQGATRGCVILQGVLQLLDRPAASAVSAQSSCGSVTAPADCGAGVSVCRHCRHSESTLSDDIAARLREAAVGLLMLEADAIKWYKEHSVPYFVELGKRLDSSVSSMATEAKMSSSVLNGDSEGGSSGQWPCACIKCSCRLGLHPGLVAITVDALIALIVEEVAALQVILLSFPSKPGGAPDAFLALETDSKWAQVLDLDLDRDGLEIISC